MNKVSVPFYLFKSQELGVFVSKLVEGDNEIICTYKLKNGQQQYPKGIIIDKQKAIIEYGLSKIQTNSNERGIFLPMRLFKEANSGGEE